MTKRYHRRAKLFGSAVLLLSLVGLVGCAVPVAEPFESPLAQATAAAPTSPGAAAAVVTVAPTAEPVPMVPVTPTPDKGAIVGTIRNSLGSLPEGAQVYVAQFVWNEAKTVGVYYLDPAHALSVPIDRSGAFQVPDLEPGPYVLVIGVKPEQAAPVMGERDQPRVIDAIAGQVTDLGEQIITLQ